MATIAWIGLGHMGIPMSKNMLNAVARALPHGQRLHPECDQTGTVRPHGHRH
jgi:hypothetical protein